MHNGAPRPSADEAGSMHQAGAQSWRWSAGAECLEVSVPDLQVLSVSPALAMRYRFRFAGPEGTSLLLWVQQESHEDVLDAIASSAATPQDKPKDTYAGIVKMLILRYSFSEIHKCSLNVRACGGNRVRLHIAWDDSVERWEEAILATGGALPHPLAQKTRHLMRTSLAQNIFTFDELRSSECMAEFAASMSTRSGHFFMGKLIEKFVSLEESKAAMLKWSGMRAVSKFATRMLQIQFVLLEGGQGGAASASAHAALSALPDLQINVRLKFPSMLGGFTTPWWSAVEVPMNGNPGDSAAVDEKFSATLRIDCCDVDPESSGDDVTELCLTVLRMTCLDTGAAEQRVVPTLLAVTKYSEDTMDVAYVLPPVTAAERGEDAVGMAGGSLEGLADAMQAQTGRHVFVRVNQDGADTS